MQRYTTYLSLKTASHASGGISIHHQEHTQLYLQHLALVKPLLLPATVAVGSSNGLTNYTDNIRVSSKIPCSN
jgi:hypothetical protein